MAAPEIFGEEFVRYGLGIVFLHANFFEDDVALFGDVFLGKERAQDQVGENVERQRQVLIKHLRTEADHLLGGKGVQVAADRVHFAGNLLGGAARGALKDHMLNEMRDAVQAGGFASRSGAKPDAHRYRACVGHGLGNQHETVGQHLTMDCGLGAFHLNKSSHTRDGKTIRRGSVNRNDRAT